MLPTFNIELEAKFQLEVSENEVVFFASKFTEHLKSSHKGFVGPSLRTAALHLQWVGTRGHNKKERKKERKRERKKQTNN